jgi:hypothetical protein
MARFLTHAYVLEKFGLRLDKHALGKALGISAATVMNRSSDGKLGLPTYVEHGKLWADAEHVAAYMDRMAEAAREKVAA